MAADRISNLPDVLLLHIFYFLPSHDLLRTSFLSTRFRYLWRSVPVLDVRENHYSSRCSLAKLMNYFLNFHEDLAIIRRFRLLCLDSLYEESDVYKWIHLPTAASCSSLEEFYVHLHSSYCLDLSHTNIFSCTKLETVGLYGGIIFREIPVDVHVFFPCLKTVRLRAISIVGSSTLNKLLSGCPRLEIFDTRDCILLSDRTREPEVVVKKLYIEYKIKPSGMMNEDDGDSNRVLSIASASIDVNYNWDLTFDFLKPILNIVKQLEICNPRICSWKKNTDDEAMVWENLTHLVLKDNEHWEGCRASSFFLKRSPNLISLVLEKKPPYKGAMSVYALPNVPYYKLETVKMTGFDGRLEMENAICLLKNALVLKKLILCGRNISEEIKTRIMDEPRASTNCEIQFYPF